LRPEQVPFQPRSIALRSAAAGRGIEHPSFIENNEGRAVRQFTFIWSDFPKPASMPAFSEMPVPMLHEVRLTMVLRSQ
jgi:hypothetical protein